MLFWKVFIDFISPILADAYLIILKILLETHDTPVTVTYRHPTIPVTAYLATLSSDFINL